MDFLHDASTPWIVVRTGLSKIRCS
jgi:hypothetical protein